MLSPRQAACNRRRLELETATCRGRAAAARSASNRFNNLSQERKGRAAGATACCATAPYAMFVLLPAFALLLKLALSRPPRAAIRGGRASTASIWSSPRTTTRSCSSRRSVDAARAWAARCATAIGSGSSLFTSLWSMRAVYGGSWAGLLRGPSSLFTVVTRCWSGWSPPAWCVAVDSAALDWSPTSTAHRVAIVE